VIGREGQREENRKEKEKNFEGFGCGAAGLGKTTKNPPSKGSS
jgi:hypothetical protein